MDITTSDIFGHSVKLTKEHVLKTLNQPHEGIAHVFVHSPKLVVIYRIKNNGSWSITVEELYERDEDTPLSSVYFVEFKDEEIDIAIRLFFNIIKSQRKDFIKYMYKKLGKSVILSNPKAIPHSNAQIYLYEKLLNDIRRNTKRRRLPSSSR
jgi:hypothetical protein